MYARGGKEGGERWKEEREGELENGRGVKTENRITGNRGEESD